MSCYLGFGEVDETPESELHSMVVVQRRNGAREGGLRRLKLNRRNSLDDLLINGCRISANGPTKRRGRFKYGLTSSSSSIFFSNERDTRSFDGTSARFVRTERTVEVMIIVLTIGLTIAVGGGKGIAVRELNLKENSIGKEILAYKT